jgi:adenylate cyclase 2
LSLKSKCKTILNNLIDPIPSLSLSNIVLLGSLGATSISIGLFLYLSHYEMSETSQPGNNGPGQIISSVRSIRLAIFLITTSLIATCAVFNVVHDIGADEALMIPELTTFDPTFEESNSTIFSNLSTLLPNLMESTTTTDSQMMPLALTEIPPIYLFLCGLSLSAISAFLHAGFILKLSMMLITVLLQTLILYTSQTFQIFQDEADSV